MGRKQILYHATTPENAEKIRREGLKRQNKPWVYLSENPISWWRPGRVVLKVRITGLNYEMYKTGELDEILICGDINPERISREDVRLPRRYIQRFMSRYYSDTKPKLDDYTNCNKQEAQHGKCVETLWNGM